MARDSDRIAVWDAKARALISRIDAALDETRVTPPEPDGSAQLDALTHRVTLRTPPPPGEIIKPAPPNMGPQPDRLDHWDAYVCRFDTDPEGDA